MKEFRVRLTETITTEYRINANSPAEAEKIAKDQWCEGEMGVYDETFSHKVKEQSLEWVETVG